jgi:valyl-tRNA synthetase
MQQVQSVITAIRATRAEMKIPPGKKITAIIRTEHKKLVQHLETYAENVQILARLEKLEVGADVAKPSPAASVVIKDAEIFIPLEGVIDVNAERERLEKELTRLTTQQEKITRKLNNQDFLSRAPEEVVSKEKAKRQDFERMITQINEHLEKLVGW